MSEPVNPWADFDKMKDNPAIDLTPADVVEVLHAWVEDWDLSLDELFVRVSSSRVTHIYVTCSDQFVWASADGEPIGPQTLPVFRQAYEDLKATGDCNEVYAPLLYCARMRNYRPQHCCYPKEAPKTWPLFDAAGPERTPGLGNPYPHPASA